MTAQERRSLAVQFCTSTAVAVAIAAVARAVAGQTIAMFLVVFLLAACTGATLSAGLPTCSSGVSRQLGLLLGTVGIWVTSTTSHVITAGQWSATATLLTTTLIAIASTVWSCDRWHAPVSLAPAVTVLAYITWYTLPIWAAGHVALTPSPFCLRIHPAMAVNGQLAAFGIWTEQPVGYTLTNLGQDVPYTLPKTVLPAALVNLTWTLFTVSIGSLRRRRPVP